MKKEEFLKLSKENSYEYCVLRDDPIATPSFQGPQKGFCLGEHTEVISEHSFEECDQLETVVFNNCLKEIGDYAFTNTKIKKIAIPNTVERIGKEVFPECIEEFSIPLHCIEYLDGLLIPFLTDITFKENRIIVKKSKRERSINIYLKNMHFDFHYFSYFRKINYIHVGYDVVFDFKTPIEDTIPFFVDKLFVENLDPDYRLTNNVLVRDADGYPLIYKRQKLVVFDTTIANLKYLPNLNYHKGSYTKFDIVQNNNFTELNGVIKNKDKRVLLIPDEEEVFVFDCRDFAKNVLQNHTILKKLVVCVDHNEELDVGSFLDMVGYYHHKQFSNDYDGPGWNDKLTIVVPNWFKKAVPSFASDYDVDVIVNDIEEPSTFLE